VVKAAQQEEVVAGLAAIRAGATTFQERNGIDEQEAKIEAEEVPEHGRRSCGSASSGCD